MFPDLLLLRKLKLKLMIIQFLEEMVNVFRLTAPSKTEIEIDDNSVLSTISYFSCC